MAYVWHSRPAARRSWRARGTRDARGARMLATACVLALLATAPACARDEASGTTVASGSEAAGPRPVIAAPTAPYVPSAVPSDAAIGGTVMLAGDAPPRAVIRPTMDQRVCGTELADPTLSVRNGRLADVVVWLDDVRSGRALPLARRYDVAHSGCQLRPRVQAVLAGGTLNVRNLDPMPQRTRVTRDGSLEVVAIIEHTGFGQVVPDDRVLARPGLLELTSDMHPWSRGWIAVFDHPYFDVTTADGQFSLEGVPPGTYELVAWHERLGRIERRVTVGEGERISETLTFGHESPPSHAR